MKQINEISLCPVTTDATELTRLGCENTELGAYHNKHAYDYREYMCGIQI